MALRNPTTVTQPSGGYATPRRLHNPTAVTQPHGGCCRSGSLRPLDRRLGPWPRVGLQASGRRDADSLRRCRLPDRAARTHPGRLLRVAFQDAAAALRGELVGAVAGPGLAPPSSQSGRSPGPAPLDEAVVLVLDVRYHHVVVV